MSYEPVSRPQLVQIFNRVIVVFEQHGLTIVPTKDNVDEQDVDGEVSVIEQRLLIEDI